MNENNKKVYVDGIWLREKKFSDGGSILNVSILASKFGAFVKQHKKADGFVNIVIAAKREPDEKSSHYAYLDTWTPGGTKPAPTAQPTQKTVTKTTPVSAQPVAPDDVDF